MIAERRSPIMLKNYSTVKVHHRMERHDKKRRQRRFGRDTVQKCIAVLQLGLLPALTGCSYTYALVGHPAVVAHRDLGKGLKATPDPQSAERVVVSGRVIHSSWGISDIKTVRKEDTVFIVLHMKHGGFGRTNLHERFTCPIDVTNGVDFIRVGKDKALVWSRGDQTGAKRAEGL